MSTLLWPHGLSLPWISQAKNTGVGCHFLLQGVSLTQEWDPLSAWQVDSLPPSTWEVVLCFDQLSFSTPNLPERRLFLTWVCKFFSKMDSNSEAYGRPWHHWFKGDGPSILTPRSLSAYIQCLPCPKDGKYVTSWSFTQTGFSPSLPCHNCYLKVPRGSRD